MGRKGQRVQQAERLEWIRQQLIGGVPDWKIRKQLKEGVRMDDGRVCKVSKGQASDDLKAIGLQYRALHDNPLVVERVVGAAAERLSRIAHNAEKAGNFHAAIRANVALVDIMGRRSERWQRKGRTIPVDDQPTAVEAGEFEQLDDADLIGELERRRSRTAHLIPLPGGKAQAS